MPRSAGLQSLVNQYHSVSTLLLTLVSLTGAPTNSLNYPDLAFNIHYMADDSLRYRVLPINIFSDSLALHNNLMVMTAATPVCSSILGIVIFTLWVTFLLLVTSWHSTCPSSLSHLRYTNKQHASCDQSPKTISRGFLILPLPDFVGGCTRFFGLDHVPTHCIPQFKDWQH